MLFNSIEFSIFLPIVFLLYWIVLNKNLKAQNLFLIIASYFFYGWWDWRFLFLILFSTIVDYTIGIRLGKENNLSKRKFFLCISVITNIGLLCFFKYFNFFLDNFVSAFTLLGAQIKPYSLNIILPIGISFYTFQTLSYTIDVYKRKLNPTKDFFAFAAFVGFFPQLVAGPIERATNLLPQFYKKRTFDYSKAVDGMRQILWGLFKKVVIADNCAVFANQIFNNSADMNGSTLILGAFFFTFQIYGDFSGYSDIAIGTSRLFGLNLRRNFAYPYFSRNIAEFWRRWHISLTSWFRDYLYIPIGGSRGSTLAKVRNVFVIFIVSGFWHGANWTFIVWGALNAIFFMPLLLTKNNRNYIDIVAKDKSMPSIRELFSMVLTFCLIVFLWIFFRSENIGHTISYFSEIFSLSLFKIPKFTDSGRLQVNSYITVLTIIGFVIIEWIGREEQYAIANINKIKFQGFRWAFYAIIVLVITILHGNSQEFIYFQF